MVHRALFPSACFAALAALAALAACGARSGLVEPDAGAAPVDVPPTHPPACAADTAVGAMRFSLADIAGSTAIDAHGYFHASVRTADGRRQVVDYNPCGRGIWHSEAVPAPRSGSLTGGAVRLATDSEVLLTDVGGDTSIVGGAGVRRINDLGVPLPPYPLRDPVVGFVALPPGLGPLLVTATGPSSHALVGLDLADHPRFTLAPWTPGTPCAMSGTVLACLDGAFDTAAAGAVLWQQAPEIVDGTYRHALPPAIAGDRLYGAFFGVSTYSLVARELHTGRALWRVELGPSSLGQQDMVMGAPVVGTGGVVYVYLNIHRGGAARGELVAIRPDGTRAWSFAADATRAEYSAFATHVVGRAGVVYLAVGRTLYAVGEDGRLRWSFALPSDANAAAPMLSPNGDLALHTDDDHLVVVRTESAGLAATAWPAATGDARNGNAR